MLKKPFMYNKILRKLVMKSGIKAIKNKSKADVNVCSTPS
jgi:hypothetical protein